jgi:hypothetical protein
MPEADSLFEEMDRMGARIGDLESTVDGAAEVDEALSPGPGSAGPRTPPSNDSDVEARLEALKRELGNR